MMMRWIAVMLVAGASLLAQTAGPAGAQLPGQVPSQPPPPSLAPGTTAAQATTARISGRILRTTGRPIRGATVTITPSFPSPMVGNTVAPPPAAAMTTTTAADGTFEFTDVRPASYRVSASRPGLVTLEYGQRRNVDVGRVLVANAGATLEHIDITLPQGATISGRVLDSRGDPVESVYVRLMQPEFVGGRRQLTPLAGIGERSTNDQGGYRFYGVPPGQYFVLASRDNLIRTNSRVVLPPGYTSTYYPGVVDAAKARAITVDLSQQFDAIDILMARVPVARISGTVLNSTGAPQSATLTLRPSRRSGAPVVDSLQSRSRADGTFDIRDVPPGDWVVQALGNRTLTAVETSSPPGRPPPPEFGSLLVTVSGEDASGVRIQMRPGSRVDGRLIFEPGSGLPPTSTTASTIITTTPVDPDVSPSGASANVSPPNASIQPDGSFAMNGLHGPRRFRVLRAPEGWSLKAVRVNGRDITDEALLFGTAQQSVTDLEIVMTDRAARITGRVSDVNGRAVPESAAVVFSVDDTRWYDGSRYLGFTRADANGVFAIADLPAGTYNVVAVDWLRGNEGGGEWQDPEFLQSMAPRAMRVTLVDGEQRDIGARVLVR